MAPLQSSDGSTSTASFPERLGTVTISVNHQAVSIESGRRSVAEIKVAGHVPIVDDLEQVIDGQLHPLPDDGFVVIHGLDAFVSHPKSTSSS